MALFLLLGASAASGQDTAVSLNLDPSPISRGMGGASAAAFWTAEPNYWANPALLGYYQGARWQWEHTVLLPGFVDLPLTTHRYTLGAYGIGFENAGRPIGSVGRTFLDLGSSSSEEVKSWGIGVSLARLIGSIAALGGGEAPAIFNHMDVAAGMSSKSTTVVRGPVWGGTARARPTDHGVLLRCSLGQERPRDPGALPLRSDLALGASVVNDNGASFQFAPNSPPVPPTRVWRLSAAIHEALGLPRRVLDRAHTPATALLLDGLEPMVSCGLIYENERNKAVATGTNAYVVNRFGLELTLINALSLRAGYVSDRSGEIVDPSWGFGIALPIGDVAGARFDYSQYPQARDSGLKSISPRSFSAFVDPIALARRLRGGPGTD